MLTYMICASSGTFACFFESAAAFAAVADNESPFLGMVDAATAVTAPAREA